MPDMNSSLLCETPRGPNQPPYAEFGSKSHDLFWASDTDAEGFILEVVGSLVCLILTPKVTRYIGNGHNLKSETFLDFLSCLTAWFLCTGLLFFEWKFKGCDIYAQSWTSCLSSAPLQCQKCATLANVSFEALSRAKGCWLQFT